MNKIESTLAAAIDVDALADRIADTAAHLDAATHRLLTDIRRFDEASGWHRQGATSCAHWLNWRCGIDLGAAREKVRVARALAGLPRVDEALSRGLVSYSKVRALTRVANADNETALLDAARDMTASQLEKLCRMMRRLAPSAESVTERRWLRTREMDDGMVRVEVQLTADEAALVIRACETSAETPNRADGLMAIVQSTLRGDEPTRPPVELTVHVDADTLVGDAGGLAISPETCRRLLCDAAIVPITEDARGTRREDGFLFFAPGGKPVVARKPEHRLPSPAASRVGEPRLCGAQVYYT